MLFRREFMAGLRDGSITVAFRRWRRPSVRSGGTLLAAGGQLEVTSVERIALDEISEDDARRAGYSSLEVLLDELQQRPEGDFYRIELGRLREDPRVALRRAPVSEDGEIRSLLGRLERFDKGKYGAWTRRVLELIQARPGVRAADLCLSAGQPRDEFKINVRKLKNLGLTESLEVGYRLSPRGEALLDTLRSGQIP